MGSIKDHDDLESIAEINVVPLVDIILVVLIIFMISAPMIMKPALPVELPKASSGDSIKDKNIIITIHQDGSTYLEDKKIDELQLKQVIQQKLVENPEIMVMISADQASQHGAVVKVMDTVKGLGVKKFGISIEKAP